MLVYQRVQLVTPPKKNMDNSGNYTNKMDNFQSFMGVMGDVYSLVNHFFPARFVCFFRTPFSQLPQ